MLSENPEWSQNNTNALRIEMLVFGKRAERVRTILVQFAVFGKHSESVWRGILSKSIYLKNSLYSESILKTFE